MTETPTLAQAIAHLRQVRATFDTDDAAAQQTAAALDVVIAHAERAETRETAEDAIADKLGDLA